MKYCSVAKQQGAAAVHVVAGLLEFQSENKNAAATETEHSCL